MLEKRQKAALIGDVMWSVNETYRALIGQPPRGPWSNQRPDAREVLISAVVMVLDGELRGPAECHENWLRDKEARGWVYGVFADAEQRRHPCMVPWVDLPVAERQKSLLFFNLVHLLAPAPYSGALAPAPTQGWTDAPKEQAVEAAAETAGTPAPATPGGPGPGSGPHPGD